MKVIQQEFDRYYCSIFKERWESLKAALALPEKQVRRLNSFAQTLASLPEELSWVPKSVWHSPSGAIDRGFEDLLMYYVQDPSSVLVAENLMVCPGEKVLDLCAAPGGKSLVLAQNLFAKDHVESELVLNEFSSGRRERLIKVVQQYIPREVRNRVWVKGKDGARFGLEVKDHFDAILLDAPCSGERHLLENPKELAGWKLQRSKGLAQKQYALLCSAWLALKKGGRLMYSTCALSPLENDGVIEKFLKKKDDVEIAELRYRGPGFELTQYGVAYRPDQSGFGPMYSCLLVKSARL